MRTTPVSLRNSDDDVDLAKKVGVLKVGSAREWGGDQ